MSESVSVPFETLILEYPQLLIHAPALCSMPPGHIGFVVFVKNFGGLPDGSFFLHCNPNDPDILFDHTYNTMVIKDIFDEAHAINERLHHTPDDLVHDICVSAYLHHNMIFSLARKSIHVEDPTSYLDNYVRFSNRLPLTMQTLIDQARPDRSLWDLSIVVMMDDVLSLTTCTLQRKTPALH